jgi:hypothetical protein
MNVSLQFYYYYYYYYPFRNFISSKQHTQNSVCLSHDTHISSPVLIIGLCILLRVCLLTHMKKPPYATSVSARFIVHFFHYMFRPLLVAIFRWLATKKTKQLRNIVRCYTS